MGIELSPRESQILYLVACGLTIPEIAQVIEVKPVTAKALITMVRDELGVDSKLQLAVLGLLRNYIPMDELRDAYGDDA